MPRSTRRGGRTENRGDPNEARPYGRRIFLVLVAGGLTSLFWGRAAWRTVSPATRALEEALPGPIATLLPGGWRIYTVGASMPRFEPTSWRLRIDGLVEHPVELSYDELLRLPRAEQVSTFHCVTGWTVDSVHWAGVRFHDLLALARPLDRAKALRFVSSEVPYTDSLTLAQAKLPNVMLAYEMNGRPLRREQGSPVRLVIPEMYGYKGVKWVQRITLGERIVDGYWERRGYDRDAWIGRSNGYGFVDPIDPKIRNSG